MGSALTKRFVLWAAVSSQPQVEKVSLENQLKLGREHASRHGGTVVAELVVPGESRDIVLFEDACQQIDAYAHLRDLIDGEGLDVLAFYNRSRLGRDAALSMTIVSLCYRHGIVPYDLESPPATLEPGVNHSDLLIGAIKSVGAQNEIMEMVRRNRDGILDRVSRGETPYQEIWGWVRKYDPDGRLASIEIDPVAAEVWRIILEWYLERGEGKPAIAEELNRRGIPSPRGKVWHKGQISWLLQKAWRYAGYTDVNSMSKKGRPYHRAKAIWPAIITEGDVLRLQAEQQRRVKARRAVSNTYRFSLMVYCAACGHRMVAQSKTVPYKDKVYYREAYRCPTGEHRKTHCAARKIHEALAAAIHLLADESTLQTLLTDTSAQRDRINSEMVTLQAHLSALDSAMLRADDAYVAGTMDADRYQRQVARVKQQQVETRAELTACQDRLQALSHAEQREQRLYTIRGIGLSLLNQDDAKVANAWLRQHFRVWVADNQVQRVEYL